MPKPDRQLELQCLYFPLIQPKLTEVDGVGGWGGPTAESATSPITGSC